MNLYKIIFSHTGPKSTEYGIKCLLLAENDEQVYEWLKSDPTIGYDKLIVGWGDRENDSFHLYNDEYDIIGSETFKEKMLRLKGDINDESYDFSDAYYGINQYGWELLKENVNPYFYSEFMDYGILIEI